MGLYISSSQIKGVIYFVLLKQLDANEVIKATSKASRTLSCERSKRSTYDSWLDARHSKIDAV